MGRRVHTSKLKHLNESTPRSVLKSKERVQPLVLHGPNDSVVAHSPLTQAMRCWTQILIGIPNFDFSSRRSSNSELMT